MQFEQNFFQLFGFDNSFDIDRSLLSDRYQQFQKEVHPDRYAHKTEREQRIAVQYTAHINEAFDTLKTPLKRATHLLHLCGRTIKPETSFSMDPMFLMQQMELRENLEEAETMDSLDELNDTTDELWNQILNEYRQVIDSKPELDTTDLDTAESCVRKLQFLDKLRREIEQAEDRLVD